jgi:uncharacterized membrane protein
MCFGSSRRESYDSPPPRRVYYGHDAYSQYAYDKDHKAYKKKNKRRAHKSTATSAIISIGASGDGGGGGGGGC